MLPIRPFSDIAKHSCKYYEIFLQTQVLANASSCSRCCFFDISKNNLNITNDRISSKKIVNFSIGETKYWNQVENHVFIQSWSNKSVVYNLCFETLPIAYNLYALQLLSIPLVYFMKTSGGKVHA